MPAEFMAATFQDMLKEDEDVTNLVEISEEFLTTANGTDYTRWEINYTLSGEPMHSVFYFLGKDDQVVIIAYMRERNAGADNDALVDEAVQTIRFEP